MPLGVPIQGRFSGFWLALLLPTETLSQWVPVDFTLNPIPDSAGQLLRTLDQKGYHPLVLELGFNTNTGPKSGPKLLRTSYHEAKIEIPYVGVLDVDGDDELSSEAEKTTGVKIDYTHKKAMFVDKASQSIVAGVYGMFSKRAIIEMSKDAGHYTVRDKDTNRLLIEANLHQVTEGIQGDVMLDWFKDIMKQPFFGEDPTRGGKSEYFDDSSVTTGVQAVRGTVKLFDGIFPEFQDGGIKFGKEGTSFDVMGLDVEDVPFTISKALSFSDL